MEVYNMCVYENHINTYYIIYKMPNKDLVKYFRGRDTRKEIQHFFREHSRVTKYDNLFFPILKSICESENINLDDLIDEYRRVWKIIDRNI